MSAYNAIHSGSQMTIEDLNSTAIVTENNKMIVLAAVRC